MGMNKKIYWKIRQKVLNCVFLTKRFLYRLSDYIDGNGEYRSFKTMIAKYSLVGIIKATILVAGLIWLDVDILKTPQLSGNEKNIFTSVIIGGIGIAGVILGLYCASVSSIYSSKYANAPQNIANAFQYDRLTRRCLSGIVDYIIFGLVLLVAALYKYEIGLIAIVTFVMWSVAVVVAYSIAGNRAYRLADVYGIAEDSNRILYRIVKKKLNLYLFASDPNFQNHFLKVADKQLDLRKNIQKFGSREAGSENTALVEFMRSNLALVELYWMSKRRINRSSIWFRYTPKYQKWHLTSDIESSLAIQTGTALRAKEEHNYWWFEDELLSINKACVKTLFEKRDYTSLFDYYMYFNHMCSTAIENKEANYYAGQLDWLRQEIERNLDVVANDQMKKEFAGIVECVSLMYLDMILESSKIYQNFDLEKAAALIITDLDKCKSLDRSIAIRGRESREYYEKIHTEIIAEGKRLTPNWIIKQQVAKEEYVYLNSILDLVSEGMENVFSLGKIFLDKGLYFEGCILFTRFYEYESKLSRFIDVIENKKKELSRYHIDKEQKWDEFRLDKLLGTREKWKAAIPPLLSDCACHFALENWGSKESFPDFLGESFNHICGEAVEAIVSNNIKQFAIDYENLSKLMLLYQEYIRSDFIKNKNIYRVEYAYYMFTSPIVEWAQIGGLAILWGEFFSKTDWMKYVKKGSESILRKQEKDDLAEKLVEYVQHRRQFMLGVASRDILETGWKQRVANAILDSGVCKSEYGLYGRELIIDSKLVRSFCPGIIDYGFMNDPSEVFWVMCVNPFLDEDKKYHTSDSWEDGMNE